MAGGVARAFTITELFAAMIGSAIGSDGDLIRTVFAVVLVLLGPALINSSFPARLGFAAGGLAGVGDLVIRRLALTNALSVPPSGRSSCRRLSARAIGHRSC